ncbi:MAG: metallophosphoesterase family protein [Roseibacillus sp.]
MHRRLFPLLWILILAPAWGEAQITRGPYLQLAHEEGITIVWRTGEAMNEPKVAYWMGGTRAVKICDGRKILRRTIKSKQPLSKAPKGTVQYEATISGLRNATIYQYAIYDGKTALSKPGAKFRFKTHPPIGVPTSTRLWVVGDSGTGALHQRLVHEAMLQYTATTKRPLDLYLHVGDMAYAKGSDDQFQTNFFAPYKETLRNTVCWASMGNHEGGSSNGKTGIGPYYDAYVSPTRAEAGGVASGREAFYSFDYGTIHLICLESHDITRKPDGAMAKWLVRDLATTKAQWIIAFWHHPPYTKGSHDSDKEERLVEMRKYIMPILEEGGVDLVLCGHSHIYERSMLIDGAYQTPTTAEGVILDDGDGRPDGDGAYRKSAAITPHNGTVAVVTGHGGKLGSDTKGIIPLNRSIVLDHGSTIIDIEGDTLTSIMLDLRGVERDRFAIQKKGVVKQRVVVKPWTPTKAMEERTGHGVKGAVKTADAAERARKAGEESPPRNLPNKVKNLIPPNAMWDYLAGGEAPETGMWTMLEFDAREEEWKSGQAGFGFGDDDDRTEIAGMKNKYTAIYIRREFEIPRGADLKRLGLAIRYDDGFVLHANGSILFSKQVATDKNGTMKVTAHEAEKTEYFPLSSFASAFRIGRNVIAFEGHNCKKDSTDFTLDPYLVLEARE